MSDIAAPGLRLDSWKAIAHYLKRDLATARRWEKSLGLPIHRVGLTGRSVFAYTREIDEWLSAARPAPPQTDSRAAPLAAAGIAPVPVASRSHRRKWLTLAAGVSVAAVGGLLAMQPPVKPADLRFEVTTTALIARAQGREQWRYTYPVTFDTTPLRHLVHLAGGVQPGVYFATRVSGGREDQQVASGTLTFLDRQGRPVRSFSFTDQVQFEGEWYGPPWALMAYAVNEFGSDHRVAVAAHHYIWDPGLVTVLDDQWRRSGTFVNAGWIEAVRWLGPDRLLIAGFSNARDGGMIALLDAAALDGQGPEPSDSRHFCENCGPDRPLRMFVFPRTEVNRVTGSRFNRTVVQTFGGGRLAARTIEATSFTGDAVDVVYEFAIPALDFVSAKFSERYWEVHRLLEAEGKITHTRQQCPDRDGPREMLAWEPATGWRTIRIR